MFTHSLIIHILFGLIVKFLSSHISPRVLSPGGGIEYLNDPDSYADEFLYFW